MAKELTKRQLEDLYAEVESVSEDADLLVTKVGDKFSSKHEITLSLADAARALDAALKSLSNLIDGTER